MAEKSAAQVTILIERDLDAPRALVFEAWTDPKHIVHWYFATDGWTTPFADVDLRAGGKFRIGFASPDGAWDFVFSGIFTEVVPPSRIAYTIDDGRPVSVDFTEIGKDRTHVRLEFAAESTHPVELQRDGWGTQVTHLAAYLAGPPPAPLPELTFERIIDAPRDVVFRAWTDPGQIMQWWGPDHFTTPRATIEPRVGGALFIEMQGPDGALYPVKGRIADYVENERLVYTNRIIETAPGVFGMEAVTAIVLADAGPGRTKLTLHQRVTKTTELAAPALSGMEEGFRQMLGKFERFVAGR